jgi:hypothetical protein
MTVNDLRTAAPDPTTTRRVLAWWPVPACIVVALVAQQLLLTSRYDVGGHAAEHLSGATAPFMAAAVLTILFWATPAARRQVDLLAAAALWFAATVLVMLGNLRVVDDLVATGNSHTPTSAVPDVADHDMANSSVWYALVAAIVLVAAFRRRGHIGNVATIGAMAAMVIPPWMIPGGGVVVLVVVRCVARARTPAPVLALSTG